MTAAYRGHGQAWDYTNSSGSDLAMDSVVTMDATLGVVNDDIADTETGVVHVVGEFVMPKASAATINQGEPVMWDSSAGEFDAMGATPASGDVMGGAIATADAGGGATTVQVMLLPGNGTLTP